MTHWIKEYTSEGDDLGVYGWFKGLALNSILKSKNTDLDSLIETYKQSYGNLSNEEITDEIVADSTMHFLNDEEFINKLVNGTEEQKSLGMKVVQWLNDIIESFKDLISHNGERLASRALREDLARYEETRDAWLVAMSKAKENMARNEAVTENSDSGELSQVQLQKTINNQKGKTLSDRIDDVLTNQNFTESHVYLGDTPQILQDLGLRKLPILMTAKHVYNGIKTKQNAINEGRYFIKDEGHHHGLGRKNFIKVINNLNNPEIIYKYSNNKNDFRIVEVFGIKDKSSNPIIVVIKPEGNGYYNSINIDSNVALSMHGRSNITNKIIDAQKNGRILYVRNLNNKNSGSLQIPGSQLPNNFSSTAVTSSLNQYKQDVNQFLKKNGKQHQLDISEDYYNSLVEENEKVKEENRYLTDVLNAEKRHEPKASDVNKIAKDILEKYGSSFGKKQLAEQLTGFYHYLKTAEHIDAGEVRSVSQAIANEVLSNTTYKDKEEVKEYQEIKDFFYNRPICVTERELHDLGYDTYGELRKNYFRKIDFRKATEEHRGNSDQVYQSFSNAFPHLVYGRRSYTDEISNMIDALETVEPKEYEAYSGEEFEQAVDRLSDEIYEAYYSIGEASLYSKYKQSYAKVKETARAELKAEYEKKYNKTVERLLERERKNEGKDSKSL